MTLDAESRREGNRKQNKHRLVFFQYLLFIFNRPIDLKTMEWYVFKDKEVHQYSSTPAKNILGNMRFMVVCACLRV